MTEISRLQPGEETEILAAIANLGRIACGPGDPAFLLAVADASGQAQVRLEPEATSAACPPRPGDVATLRVRVGPGGSSHEIRALGHQVIPRPDAAHLTWVFGPVPGYAATLGRDAIAFDLETVPRFRLEELPERERGRVIRLAEEEARRAGGRGEEAVEREIDKALALDPLTNRIVSAAFHAIETGAELALMAAPGTELGPPLWAVEERELLQAFWAIARRARHLVGFSSRRFDLPVALTRSALLGVPRGIDLLAAGATAPSCHVDLHEVFAARGERRTSLEKLAFAFGVPVKTTGHGSEVTELVTAGRWRELGEYNLEDARATATLYRRLQGTWL